MNRAGTIVDRERGAKAENRVARHSRVWNPIFVCEIRHGACGLLCRLCAESSVVTAHAGRFPHLIPTPHSRIVVNIFINSVIQRAEGGFTRRLVWGARRQGASPHISRAHTHPIHSLSETERRAAQEVFASEGRRVMSRCRLAEDDSVRENFGLRFRRRPRRARAVRARRAVRRPKRRSATRSFYKKNIPFPVRSVFVTRTTL